MGANGRSAALSALPVSVSGFAVDGVALSPDGSRLAIAVQSCQPGNCPYAGIRVVTLATGAASTWATRAQQVVPGLLSWDGNGQVAFAGDGRGYRLLSVAGPGGNLLAASRPMVSPAAVALGRVPPALITPDGSALITSTARNIPEGNGRDTVVAKIVELSARTGQLLRVLHTVTKRDVMPGPDGVDNAIALDGDCRVMALGPTGVHALIECFGFGRLDGSRFTPLPGVPNFNATTFSANDFSGAATW